MALALVLVVAAGAGCAPAASGTIAEKVIRAVDPRPGEPMRSMFESHGPTNLDSRLQSAIDADGPEPQMLGAGTPGAPKFPPVPASVRQVGAGLEEIAYRFSDGSLLLVQIHADSSRETVLLSMTTQ